MDWRRLCALVVFVCAASVSGVGRADVLVLINGDRLTGSLDSIVGGDVIFDSRHAGRLVIALTAIESMETRNVAVIRLASGEEVNGRLVTVGSEQAVQVNGAVRTITLAEVRRLAENRIKPVDLGRAWNNQVDLNAALATGNTRTISFRARAESTLRRVDSEHVYALVAHFEETEGSTTRNQVRLGYDYRWFFRDDWYLVGNGEYFQDRVRDIDQRTSIGGGLGHRFWEDSLGKLSVEVSGGATYEDLSLSRETSPAARWAMEYQRFFLGKRIELFNRNRVLKIFESGRGEILTVATGVRYAMNERWSANAVVDLQHETRPRDGKGRTDIVYSLGVGVRF